MTKTSQDTNGGSPWLDADEIKRQVSIEDILSHYGLSDKLERKGSRLTGLSPFREGGKKSFSVDTEKNIWNDFNGKPDVPGNVIGLVQALENCSFREALVILHRHFIAETVRDTVGDNVEDRHAYPPACPEKRPEPPQQKDPTPEPPENQPFGKELKGLRFDVPLLGEKGITAETCKELGVGYCTSGLMKGRIAFPVKNADGEIMAYAGRAVKKTDEEKNGKYRFPPKFSKSIELFNIDRVAGEAKKAVKDFGIVVVKGFTDAMKLHQEGFPNVVALMGSDFHEAQRAVLLDPKMNPTRRITLFLDDNEAGRNAKRKIAQKLIHDAFIRYADYNAVVGDRHACPHDEPEHFNHDELVQILGLRK